MILVKIGYIILAHRYPAQLKRLILSLWDKDAYFLVHIDRRKNVGIFKSAFSIAQQKRIYFLSQLQTPWGGFGLVQATLNALKYLSERKVADYLVLLSGQDFPIKSTTYIKGFFLKYCDEIFISYRKIPKEEWYLGGITRFSMYDEISKIISLYGGSQWWSMPIYIAGSILKFLDINTGFVEYFKKVQIPDESFFQTVLLNMKELGLVGNITDDNLRFIIWKDEKPKVLGIEDFSQIRKSSKLFARKFECGENPEFLLKVERLIAKNA